MNKIEDKIDKAQWISVETSMPKVGQDVLIYTKKGQIKISCWLGNKYHTDDGHRRNWIWPGNFCPTVLYWMPLPEPPKTEENEQDIQASSDI